MAVGQAVAPSGVDPLVVIGQVVAPTGAAFVRKGRIRRRRWRRLTLTDRRRRLQR